MLPPDPPITFYTITLTLAEVTGDQSRRLAKQTVLRTRILTAAQIVYDNWRARLYSDTHDIPALKGGDTDAT